MFGLAFYQEGDVLQVALLHKDKQKTIIKFLRSFVITSDVKPLYTLDGELEKKEFITISGMSFKEISLRKTQTKLLFYPQIVKILPFLAEEQIPFLGENGVYLSHIDIDKEKKVSHITFFATQKNFLEKHLLQLAAHDIEPDFISSSVVALWRFSRHFFQEKDHLYMYYIGEDQSAFLSIQNGKIDFSFSLQASIKDSLLAVAADHPEFSEEEIVIFLKNVQIDQITKDHSPYLHSFLEKTKSELARISSFCEKKKNLCGEIVLCGKPARFSFIKQLMEEAFPNLPIEMADEDISSHAICIGLALDGLAQDQKTLQFRKTLSASKKEKTNEKKLLQSACLVSLSMVALTLVFGWLICIKKENRLLDNAKSYFSEQHLSISSLQEKLGLKESQLSNKKSPITYQTPNPLVSDLLIWLSNFPKMDSEKIKVKNFHYQLTSYPRIGFARQPYQAKVEVSFTAPTSKSAKIFQEYLLSSPYIDTTQKTPLVVRESSYEITLFVKSVKK